MTKDKAEELTERVMEFLYYNTDCTSSGACRFIKNLKALVEYWTKEEEANNDPIEKAIKEAPEVEAIPIEFIKLEMAKAESIYYDAALRELLARWKEKENE